MMIMIFIVYFKVIGILINFYDCLQVYDDLKMLGEIQERRVFFNFFRCFFGIVNYVNDFFFLCGRIFKVDEYQMDNRIQMV